MSFDFSPDTKHESPNVLIPAGTLSLAVLKVRKLKNSASTGGEYADIELTLDGEFRGRKVWPMIANPSDTRNNETWRQMAMAAIQHACEACALFVPQQPETYKKFANASFTDVLTALDGKTVAVKIGVEKGKDGHQDKNGVAAWLTPNPVAPESKLWAELMGNPVQAAGTVPASSPVAAVQGNKPSWLS